MKPCDCAAIVFTICLCSSLCSSYSGVGTVQRYVESSTDINTGSNSSSAVLADFLYCCASTIKSDTALALILPVCVLAQGSDNREPFSLIHHIAAGNNTFGLFGSIGLYSFYVPSLIL